MHDLQLGDGAGPATAVNWCDEVRLLHCRVCGAHGEGRLIARITALAQHDLPLVRCSECGSIDILDSPLDSSPTDASVDGYVEAGAGIGTIMDSLLLADPSNVTRFLDVGCNYGFALDLGRFFYRWDVLGIEPSLSGNRGARELGLDIRHEYLTGESAIGDGFDLILASEVVEHVPQPLDFLSALNARVASNGAVVLTTPAAEIIRPESPLAEILGAVSAGYHSFIASERGLGILLRNAGFASVHVRRDRGNLKAMARRGPTTREEFDPPRVAPSLAPYYDSRANSAEPGSSLALGMAVRYLRTTVAEGQFHAAQVSIPRVIEAFAAAHDLNVSDPAAAAMRITQRGSAPWSLAGAAFALGMVELLHTQQPHRAAEFFHLSTTAARIWRDAAGVADLDTVDLLFLAPYHRVLALAQFDGDAATDEAERLGTAPEFRAPESIRRTELHLCRAFVDIVSRGTYRPESPLAARVARVAAELGISDDPVERLTGLDALFSLGIAHLNSGMPVPGTLWLRQCRDLCLMRGRRDAHSRRLAKQCSSALSTVDPQPASASVMEEDQKLHHFIDVYWCDAYGTYLQGWAHLEGDPVESLAVDVDGRTVLAARSERPDLLAFWPEHKPVALGGFSVYVPGRPGGVVKLRARTASRVVECVVDLPDHPLPIQNDGDASRERTELESAWMELAPPGPVLALGVRSSSAENLARQLAPFAGREIVGFDIHPGLGVDVEGDVHELSRHFPAGQFAVVWSWSLFEHVTTPWLVAAEIAKVLQIGGLAVIGAPWVWPSHATPQDFWRFSPDGLQQIFDSRLGFAAHSAGSMGPAAVVPSPGWRAQNLAMPTTSSDSTSWIIARKVDDRADLVSWPYDGQTESSAALRYPLDGLALEVNAWIPPTESP